MYNCTLPLPALLLIRSSGANDEYMYTVRIYDYMYKLNNKQIYNRYIRKKIQDKVIYIKYNSCSFQEGTE